MPVHYVEQLLVVSTVRRETVSCTAVQRPSSVSYNSRDRDTMEFSPD